MHLTNVNAMLSVMSCHFICASSEWSKLVNTYANVNMRQEAKQAPPKLLAPGCWLHAKGSCQGS